MKLSEQKRFSLKAEGGFEKRTFELMSMLLLWINAAWISRQRERARARSDWENNFLINHDNWNVFPTQTFTYVQPRQQQQQKSYEIVHKSCMIYCTGTEIFQLQLLFMLARAYKRNAESKHNQKHTNLCLPTILTTFPSPIPPPKLSFSLDKLLISFRMYSTERKINNLAFEFIICFPPSRSNLDGALESRIPHSLMPRIQKEILIDWQPSTQNVQPGKRETKYS